MAEGVRVPVDTTGAVVTGDRGPIPQTESRLASRLADALAQHHEVSQRAHAGNPAELPDATRQLFMLQGALEGVEQRAAELVAKLEPILRDGAHDHLAKLEHARRERAENPRERDELDPRCQLGRTAASCTARVSQLEELLGMVTQLVEL